MRDKIFWGPDRIRLLARNLLALDLLALNFLLGAGMVLAGADAARAQDAPKVLAQNASGYSGAPGYSGNDAQNDVRNDPDQDPAAPRSILFPSDDPGPYIPPETLPGEAVTAPSRDPAAATGREGVPRPGLSEQDPKKDIEDNIIVSELGVQDPASYGLLTPGQGGFAAALWQGSSRETILRFFPVLPAQSRSPVVLSLVRRLLFSAVPAPGSSNTGAETGMEEAPERSDPERNAPGGINPYLEARLDKIIATGDLRQLTAFFQILPPGTLPATRDYADILLLAGDLPGACEMTRQALENGGADRAAADHLFWLKMLAYCRAVEGNAAGANVALDMLQEEGGADYAYVDLINKLLAGGADSGNLTVGYVRLDPLTYSLLSTLGQPADGDLLAGAAPLVQYAVAGNAKLPAEMRLAAAHRAYQAGRFPVARLRAIYNLQEFAPSEIRNALTLAEGEQTALADALLYQAAAKQIDPLDKARLLTRIWDRALLRQDLPRAARLNLRTVQSLTPDAALMDHAPHLVRALLLGGDGERARQWYDFIRSAAFDGNAPATRALVDVWPLMLVTDRNGRIPWSTEILDLWGNGQMMLPPAERNRKAALFYSVMEALGQKVPEALWRDLGPDLVLEPLPQFDREPGRTPERAFDRAFDRTFDRTGPARDMARETGGPRGLPRHGISPVIWRHLLQSARRGRLGETVLFNLIALGPTGPAGLETVGLTAVIRAFRAVGLEQEARQTALEGLAGRGF